MMTVLRKPLTLFPPKTFLRRLRRFKWHLPDFQKASAMRQQQFTSLSALPCQLRRCLLYHVRGKSASWHPDTFS